MKQLWLLVGSNGTNKQHRKVSSRISLDQVAAALLSPSYATPAQPRVKADQRSLVMHGES